MTWRHHQQRPAVLDEITQATADLRGATGDLLDVVAQVKQVAADFARLLPPPEPPDDPPPDE